MIPTSDGGTTENTFSTRELIGPITGMDMTKENTNSMKKWRNSDYNNDPRLKRIPSWRIE